MRYRHLTREGIQKTLVRLSKPALNALLAIYDYHHTRDHLGRRIEADLEIPEYAFRVLRRQCLLKWDQNTLTPTRKGTWVVREHRRQKGEQTHGTDGKG